ncbi:PQQ-binding-like beta-propeller repeat protein [Streptomyces avermitilis]|uniref:outer membrane protein assembly factor BamB family protein n=1 Tax=Streptomyces avermitilis TaxID=33903 RepID=UPI0033A4AA39
MSFGPPPSVYTQSALAADQARSRGRMKVLGAVAALVVAVLCAGGWLLLSAGGDASTDGKAAPAPQRPDEIRETVEKIPSTPEGRLVMEHSEDGLAKHTADPRYAPGTWATGKIFAKGIARRVVGYKIQSQSEKAAWTLELGGHICATSRHVTADGRTAVVVQPSKPEGSKTAGVCNEVVFFDLDTGKKLWQAKMPSANQAYVTNTNLTLTRGVVAVAWRHGSVAYDMKNGKQLWDSTAVSNCEDEGFAGGRALLALVSCGEAPGIKYEVQKLDPRTGRADWTYKVAGGIQAVYLPSSDPPVLAVAAGDITVTDLITLDDNGKHLATVSLAGDRFDPGCGQRYFAAPYFGVLENCDRMVVGRKQMYVATKEGFDAAQPANWIVAFDVETGKTAGKFDGRPFQSVLPLRMSGDELLIYRRTFGSVGPAAVVRWNPRTDKESPFLLFHLPEDDESELSDPEQSDIIVEKDRVFFAKRELTADDKHPKDPVLAAIGVGSAGVSH